MREKTFVIQVKQETRKRFIPVKAMSVTEAIKKTRKNNRDFKIIL